MDQELYELSLVEGPTEGIVDNCNDYLKKKTT